MRTLFKEIQKAYEPFCQMEAKFETNPNYAAEADNGEYLIRRGTYIVVGNPKVFEYEQIYKKVNGTYLIYHDEFSFE
jgi:lipopolysaccharide export system protein LptA